MTKYQFVLSETNPESVYLRVKETVLNTFADQNAQITEENPQTYFSLNISSYTCTTTLQPDKRSPIVVIRVSSKTIRNIILWIGLFLGWGMIFFGPMLTGISRDWNFTYILPYALIYIGWGVIFFFIRYREHLAISKKFLNLQWCFSEAFHDS